MQRAKKNNWRENTPEPCYIKREDEHLWPGKGEFSPCAFIPDAETLAKREAQKRFEESLPPAPGAARE